MSNFNQSSFIAGDQRVSDSGFFAVNPTTKESLEGSFASNTTADVDAAVNAAHDAFAEYSQTSGAERAEFLRAIAGNLEGLREQIVNRAMAETGLPDVRLNGELGRTTGQLELFASLLEEGKWVRAVIDTAMPDRQPLPRPDIRLTSKALGPVAVFGASNFPLAFSTAGGDTASALAAGCPVIVKAHPAHPGTAWLVAKAIDDAVKNLSSIPSGVFSIVFDEGHEIGSYLVQHPKVKAVGFTGSLGGGRALFDLAQQRPEPIPFYGELGSSNPVFVLDGALKNQAQSLAEGYVTSLTMGCGQFCTNPGIVVAVKGEQLDKFIGAASNAVTSAPAQTMLTESIAYAYSIGEDKRRGKDSVVSIALGKDGEQGQGQASLQKVSAAQYLADPELEHEIFGPAGLVVECEDTQELIAVAESFGGHLTSTIHCEDSDEALSTELSSIITGKVGRILYNGWPTGVEVNHAMMHGGPYPASTDSRSTSVGSRAIDRWVRPVSYQNAPDYALPDELKRDNPLNIWRQIDGEITRDAG